jgi:CheY-like chemotaxis protein
MSESQQEHPGPEPARDGTAPPASFAQWVKEALEHLYDFAHLEQHPLAYWEGLAVENASRTPGQRLRYELITTVELLNPGPDVPFRTPHARLYNLLHMHYVQGDTIQQAAQELGISLRQAYRDLRHGVDSVASLLWAQHPSSVPKEPRAVHVSSVQSEISRLETQPRPIDVSLLLDRAQQAVGPLARRQGVDFEVEIPDEPVVVSANPVVAQQVLVHALSHSIQQARKGPLQLLLVSEQDGARLALRYAQRPEAVSGPVISDVVTQLIERLRWRVSQEDLPGQTRILTLHMATRGPVVLVVDDNEGLVDLLSRYLSGHACRVVAATSGREGLHLAQELLPDAIVLDVMMPEMDGWGFLQRLRARKETAHTPVVICSVISDPELAYSLGASLFLPKPVSRDDVLTALHELSVV